MIDVKIKTAIIDDEPLAREKIRTFLKDQEDIEVMGECKDSLEAIELIKKSKPDLIFLDIKMPGMNAFEMLENLNKNLKVKEFPLIIFTTAFDKYALKAFEVHALDYLLKPFDRERFLITLERARTQLTNKISGENSKKILQALEDLKRKDNSINENVLERIVIKSSERIYFVQTSEIEWLEASGNYIKIFANGASHLTRDTMNSMEKKLNPQKFVRIHRSIIVNVDFIKEFKPWFNGEYEVYMKNKTKFTSGRTYKNNIDSILKI